MTRTRVGIIAAVVLVAALVVVGLVSGANRRACTGPACDSAGSGGTANSPGRGTQPPGGTAGTPAPGGTAPAPVATDAPRPNYRLTPGQRLARGETLFSPDGRYRLTLQSTDGNLVLVEDGKTVLWATGPARDAAVLTNQTDGNLVLYRANGTAAWSSGTAGKGELFLYLFDDGNLVLLDRDNREVWETDTGSNR